MFLRKRAIISLTAVNRDLMTSNWTDSNKSQKNINAQHEMCTILKIKTIKVEQQKKFNY